MTTIRCGGHLIRGPAGTGIAALARGPVSVSAIRLATPYLAANPAAGAVVGALSCVTRGGGLVNPVYTLVNSAGGDFLIVNGNQVATLPSGVPGADYTIVAQVTAANLAAPFQQSFVIRVATGSGGGGAPGPLTGLTFTQREPLSSDAGPYVIWGYLDPVGGIGPYTFSDGGGLTNANCEYSQQGNVDIYIYSGDISTVTNKTVTFTVKDARGATASCTATIQVASGPTLTMNNRMTWPNVWADSFDYYPALRHPYGDGLAVLDTSTGQAAANWQNIYGGVHWRTAAQATPGSYPLTFTLGGRTVNETVVVQAFTPITYIEFLPGTLSTATVVSTVLGRACATTPANSPSWSINDPSGTLAIDSGGNVSVIKTPTVTGAFSFSITVTDNLARFTQSFSITVVQGNTIDPSQMGTSGMTLAFNNVTVNNVIGAPTLPSAVTGTPTWRIVSQSMSFPGLTPRYQINSSTGQITAPLNLSAGVGDTTATQTDALVVTVSDGVNTCTRTIDVVVSWGPVVATYYVGRGMSAAHGANGFETLTAIDGLLHYRGVANGVWQFNVYADADPTYYLQTTINNYIAGSPTIFVGVAANGQPRPIIGGRFDGFACQPGPSAKGVLVFGGCDSILRNVEIGGANDAYSDGINGPDGVHYESGNGYAANNAIQDCILHTSSNNILCGEQNGTLLVEYTEIHSGGTSHHGGGFCHNLYVDPYLFIFRYNASHHSGGGHLFKARARVGKLYGNRIFDGLSGYAPACIEMPNGGDYEIYDNVIEKGAMTCGPGCIQYAAETLPFAGGNNLNVHDNTISVLRQPGAHDDLTVGSVHGAAAIYFFATPDPVGNFATMQVTNNQVFLCPGASLIVQSGTPVATNETGTTYIALPPAIDMTAPWDNTKTMAVDDVLFRTMSEDTFVNAAGVNQNADRAQIRVSAAAAAGTVLANLSASNDLGAQGDGATPNPFVAGTTWAFQPGGIYYPENNPSPWAAAGKYGVTVNSNGTAVLTAGTGLTANTLDYVQLRATAPNGTISDHRYPIMVTA